MRLKTYSLLMAIVFCAVVTARTEAGLITSSFGTTSGVDDDNQAGPLRGVTYQLRTGGSSAYTNPTVTQGSSSGANSYTATHAFTGPGFGSNDPQVEFQQLTWQRSSSTTGITTTALFVSIFDGLTVNSSGTVTALGTLMGASTNSISSPGVNAAMTWNFNNVLLNAGQSYQFVFTTTATPTVVGDISFQALELKTGTNLLQETELVAGNASSFTNRAGWEPVFSMTYNAVPEPNSMILVGSLGLVLLRRRRV